MDRAEIQSVIDSGATVELPAGTFTLDGPLVTGPATRIIGAGVGVTTLKLAAAAGTDCRSSRLIESRWAHAAGPAGSPPGTDWDDRTVIRDLTLDGNGAAQVSPAASVACMNADLTAAIVLDHVRQPQIENVEVIGARYRGVLVVNSTQGSDDRPNLRNVRVIGAGYTGIALINVWSAIVTECRAESCTRAGIYLEASRYSTVGHCLARNTRTTPGDGAGDGYGFVADLINGDGFVAFTGNVASVCRSDGFIVTSDGTPYSYVLIDGNVSTGNGGAGFHTWRAPSVVFGANLSKWNVADATVITP